MANFFVRAGPERDGSRGGRAGGRGCPVGPQTPENHSPAPIRAVRSPGEGVFIPQREIREDVGGLIAFWCFSVCEKTELWFGLGFFFLRPAEGAHPPRCGAHAPRGGVPPPPPRSPLVGTSPAAPSRPGARAPPPRRRPDHLAPAVQRRGRGSSSARGVRGGRAGARRQTGGGDGRTDARSAPGLGGGAARAGAHDVGAVAGDEHGEEAQGGAGPGPGEPGGALPAAAAARGGRGECRHSITTTSLPPTPPISPSLPRLPGPNAPPLPPTPGGAARAPPGRPVVRREGEERPHRVVQVPAEGRRSPRGPDI